MSLVIRRWGLLGFPVASYIKARTGAETNLRLQEDQGVLSKFSAVAGA
jgi:hypothetical protein